MAYMVNICVMVIRIETIKYNFSWLVDVKEFLIFFKDVEVGMLNCNVKWKIS
jgi:hypothetical protein